MLENLFSQIPHDASILDVGCLGFRQYRTSRRLNFAGHRHFGIDYTKPTEPVPKGFVFKGADLNKKPIPFKDDSFHLVVASHVMEHLRDPVQFFGECLRVCKPGGLLYVEVPSERSLFLPGMPFKHDKFFSLSFFDDPTHLSRPWSPQSLHRLTRYFQCEPVHADYIYSLKHRLLFPALLAYAWITRNAQKLEIWSWGAVGWASYLVARKPLGTKGKPPFKYYIPER